jgi:hypothetical protein
MVMGRRLNPAIGGNKKMLEVKTNKKILKNQKLSKRVNTLLEVYKRIEAGAKRKGAIFINTNWTLH